MAVFAISDLHLSGTVNKPMNIFGDEWDNHWKRIRSNWFTRVTDKDIVLIPGDISWAMKLDDAIIDLKSIGELPGQKVMIRGNHDYWWSSISKVREALPKSTFAIQNDSLCLNNYTICGSRGWINPGTRTFDDHDQKIYEREVSRLRLSLDSAPSNENLIVLIHYPPFDDHGGETKIVKVLDEYKPLHVVYGHLHGEGTKYGFEGMYNNTYYHLVSCDYLGFELKQIV